FEAVFDAGGCKFPLLVRSVAKGDRVECWGGGTKRVSRIMIDAKIPGMDRWRIPLLFSGDRLLWIAGLRRSRHLPVGDSTSKVLLVRFIPGRTLMNLLKGTQ
ncbi:MAG: tRNA(Ile)-lysidine synthetase, partial [Deltaproteobacteria bacterium]